MRKFLRDNYILLSLIAAVGIILTSAWIYQTISRYATEDDHELSANQISAAGFYVATIQAVLTVLSLFFTGWAAMAASRAAEAAVAANQSQRAWLHVMGMGLTNYPSAFALYARWMNVGQTAALDATVFVEFRLVDSGEDIPYFDFKDTDVDLVPIMPNLELSTSSWRFTNELKEDLLTRRKSIYLASSCYYTDVVSNKRRYTHLVALLQFYAFSAEQGGAEEFRVSFSPRGKQNRAC